MNFTKKQIIIILSGLGVLFVALILSLIIFLLPKDTKKPESSSSINAEPDVSSVISNHQSSQEDTVVSSTETSSVLSSASSKGPSSALESSSSTAGTPPASQYLDYTKYTLDAYMNPVWETKVIYNESVMFVPNAVTKVVEPAPLLYTPEKIISVRSADLKTEYKEGIDYVIENGKIKLTPKTSIWAWDYDDYYPLKPSSVPIASVSAPGRYILYASSDTYADTQLAVTYTHKGTWSGIKPQYAGDQLKNTIAKLKSKQSLNIVYYGDSIMVGCDASGLNGHEPNMPIFSNMIVDKLKKTYGYNNIKEINTAVGGKHSEWGRENVQESVVSHNPDLVIIGFGMNDSGLTVEVDGANQAVDIARYEYNIRTIISEVRKKKPNTEFILVSTTVPNPDCAGWTNWQPKYKTGLENIAKNTTGVAIAPMTDMQAYILTKKRYADMNGNGVNHPNDFMARVYAQTISQCLIQKLD